MSTEAFIDAEKADYSVTLLCRVAGISPSRYYQLRKKTMSPRGAQDGDLEREIRLMSRLGLKAKTAKKYKVTTDSRHSLPIAPNLAILKRSLCEALHSRTINQLTVRSSSSSAQPYLRAKLRMDHKKSSRRSPQSRSRYHRQVVRSVIK